MHLVTKVEDHEDLCTTIVASGFGTTIISSEADDTIEFGDSLTNQPCVRNFTLTNKGRRTQHLTWEIDSKAARDDDGGAAGVSSDSGKSKRAGADSASSNGSDHAGWGAKTEVAHVFSVMPIKLVLEPGQSRLMTITGLSTKAQHALTKVRCYTTMGKQKSIFSREMTVSCNFTQPLLDFSSHEMSFCYMHSGTEPFKVLTQTLTVTNASVLPLSGTISISKPFSLYGIDFFGMAPNAEAKVHAQLDPSFQKSLQSKHFTGELKFEFTNHPTNGVAAVKGDVWFPNLELSDEKLTFASVLEQTDIYKTITITNNGPIRTNYHWALEMPHSIGNDSGVATAEGSMESLATEVFEAVPMRSSLEPGESEDVRFCFRPRRQGTYSMVAECHAQEGPVYNLQLQGVAAPISYNLDTSGLDFGQQLFATTTKKSILLKNMGNVKLDFEIRLPPKFSKAILVAPMIGTVPPTSEMAITVAFHPRVPGNVEARFHIQVCVLLTVFSLEVMLLFF